MEYWNIGILKCWKLLNCYIASSLLYGFMAELLDKLVVNKSTANITANDNNLTI
jgi:hypothetical protein